MSEFTVHCVMVFRNKKTRELRVKTATMSGVDLSGRIETFVTVWSGSYGEEWELISFSHAFLPFKIPCQI